MREYLIKLRKAGGYSQVDVADKMGISQQYYSFIESGERLKSLPVDIIIKLSKVFGISNEKMLEYECEWRKEN